MYCTGKKNSAAALGTVSWFSVDNQRDREQIGENGEQILIKQIHHLTKYAENLLCNDWENIMKSTLEF
jgi:hypothetical protein